MFGKKGNHLLTRSIFLIMNGLQFYSCENLNTLDCIGCWYFKILNIASNFKNWDIYNYNLWIRLWVKIRFKLNVRRWKRIRKTRPFSRKRSDFLGGIDKNWLFQRHVIRHISGSWLVMTWAWFRWPSSSYATCDQAYHARYVLWPFHNTLGLIKLWVTLI